MARGVAAEPYRLWFHFFGLRYRSHETILELSLAHSTQSRREADEYKIVLGIKQVIFLTV
ncbi:hypothetical protein Plhal304r1_c031g0100171 [Plasmopara halstedii]